MLNAGKNLGAEGKMPRKTLLQELRESRIDFDKRPLSFHSGGLEDPCRIEPDNIIAFFSPQEPKSGDKARKWYHQYYQIKCNLAGTAFLGLDELKFQLPTQCGIVIFPFQVHYFDLTAPRSSRFFLTIKFLDRGSGRESLLPLMNQPFKINEEDFPLLKTVVGAYQKLPGYQPEDGVNALRLFLSRKLRQSKTAAGTIPFSSPFIDEILRIVRDHPGHSLGIKDLAESMHISESHLRLKFRRTLNGIPLGTFLHHLRFQRAYELIEHTDLPITEIARKCGYGDVCAFSRFFKKDSGLSPTLFRKKKEQAK